LKKQLNIFVESLEGPVSAEVIGLTVDEMVEEARNIATWVPNVVVKIPMTEAGLETVHILSKEGIKTNVTIGYLCCPRFDGCKSRCNTPLSEGWMI